MKILALISLFALCVTPVFSQDKPEVDAHIFNFSIELEVSNDQGTMETGEYLREYGTKGKTRAISDLYPILDSCYMLAFERKGLTVHPSSTLSNIRANSYGFPVMSLKKAIKNGEGTQFLRIHLKDIGFVNPEQAMVNSNTVKVVEMRCRIQLYDLDRNLIRTAEATFKTGEKVDPKYNLGVDLRQFRGSGYMQEVKFYEVCCKMAFFRALEQF